MKLDIYDKLRQFHKNIIHKLLDRKGLSSEETNALEVLDGVLYLVEKEFCKEPL